MSVRVGLGDGQFRLPDLLPKDVSSGGAAGSALGDWNGDRELDLAASNQFAANVSVILTQDAHTFSPAQTFAAGASVYALEAGDLDGDGTADLCALTSSASTAVALFGAGDGAFSAPVGLELQGFCVPLALADLDGDGDLDVLAGRLETDSLEVLPGLGAGSFGRRSPIRCRARIRAASPWGT